MVEGDTVWRGIDSARAIEGWQELVKNAKSNLFWRKLISIVCSRGVKWWDEDVNEAIRVWT